MLIYQIELCNVCSLACPYCPHPHQKRRRGMMDAQTFDKCLTLQLRTARRRPLHLHNFGEPTLHPDLPRFIRRATERGVECIFFTNGMQNRHTPVAPDYWRELSAAGLRRVNFSAHLLAEEAFRALAGQHLRVERVFTPSPATLGTWAGQVGKPSIPDPRPCFFARHDAFVVLWNGNISRCCLDVEGTDSPGHIDEILDGRPFSFRPIQLCGGCDSLRDYEDD